MAGGIPTTNLQVPTVPQPTATPYNRQQQIGLALSALSDVFAKRDPIAGTMQRQAFLQAQKQKEEQQKLLQELAQNPRYAGMVRLYQAGLDPRMFAGAGGEKK